MKKLGLWLLLVGLFLAGYVVGAVQALHKFLQEQAFTSAMYVVAVEKAKDAKDAATVEKVERLRRKSAFEAAAAVGTANWPRAVLYSVQLTDYSPSLALIDDYAVKHPEAEIAPEARAYFAQFRVRRPNKAPEPTPTSVTPPANSR